jgi:hypothetical protein
MQRATLHLGMEKLTGVTSFNMVGLYKLESS